MKQFFGSDKVPTEEDKGSSVGSPPEKVANGDISHETELETKGTMTRKKGSKVHALLGTSFTNTVRRLYRNLLNFVCIMLFLIG